MDQRFCTKPLKLGTFSEKEVFQNQKGIINVNKKLYSYVLFVNWASNKIIFKDDYTKARLYWFLSYKVDFENQKFTILYVHLIHWQTNETIQAVVSQISFWISQKPSKVSKQTIHYRYLSPMQTNKK